MTAEFVVDRDLYPFESRWFNGRSGRMHYIDEGQGPPIVFFHGNPTWSFLYRNVITRLRGQFRCIAMDYLGFGLSEHPDDFGYTVEEQSAAVGELIDHLELNDFITVGQDWAARSAWPWPLCVMIASAVSYWATPGFGPQMSGD